MAEMLSGISDTIMDGLQAILYATIYKFLYYLAVGCCWIIDLLYNMFEIMAGLNKVSYDGDYDYLINIFFSNTTVSKVYWGMALIGLAVGFAFAIAAVIKKLFDTSEKEKRSYGQILTGLFKSILIIVCLSLIITMVLNATTLLMQQINYVFINADDLGEEKSITYTDEEYAAMARALNTIGNFSLNPSYNNRFNLNKCFNAIRLDLQYLKTQGVFDFHYVTTDVEGNTIATWQSVLQKIANSASLDRDLSLDVYHESTSNAITQAMDLLKVNGSFKPLEVYQRHYQPSRSSVPMDRLLFLMASMRAAKNDDYNKNPSLTDPLRGAYYYGEKSIYNLDTVNEDFDIGIAALDYVILFLTCFKMLATLATIILNCVGRIFNMLLLYLIAPLIVAVSPLDDGAKFKQWTTAFIVQSFSVFGTVISMRVLLLFMPVIIEPKLVLFENPIANLLTKLVIILGAFEVSEKATNLITGILADNAGWQSITAGDMSGTAKNAVRIGESLAKTVGGGALKTVGGVGLSALGFGAKVGLKGAAGVGLGLGYGAYYGGKAAGQAVYAGGKAVANKISAWRNSGKNNQAGGTNDNTNTEGTGGSAPPDTTTEQPNQLPNSLRDTVPGDQQVGPPNAPQGGTQPNPQGSTQPNPQGSAPPNPQAPLPENRRDVIVGNQQDDAPVNPQGNVQGNQQDQVQADPQAHLPENNRGIGENPPGVVNKDAGGVQQAPDGNTNVNTQNSGNPQGANAPQQRQIAEGIRNRVEQVESRINAQRTPVATTAPNVKVSEGIKAKAAKLEAHMNANGTNANPVKKPPLTVRNRQNNNS